MEGRKVQPCDKMHEKVIYKQNSNSAKEMVLSRTVNETHIWTQNRNKQSILNVLEFQPK